MDIDIITEYIENSYGDEGARGDALEKWECLKSSLIKLEPILSDISNNPDNDMGLPMDHEIWPDFFAHIKSIASMLKNVK